MRSSLRGRSIGRTALLLGAGITLAAGADAKSFIDYLKPTPITCAPLSSASWGVAGVLPRDLCNGIESAKGAAVPPEFYYWDGQILKARDGKYHLFMSTWSGSAGFNPGWLNSEAYHAVSQQGVLGPYMRQGYVYDNGGSHKGHNVTALELSDGSYAVVVSETVAFTIYKSSSLDGPWTKCSPTIATNGVNAGTDAHYDSNVSVVERHDGKFEMVQRHGLIGISDTLCGQYKMEKPTWSYPAANRPSIDSIYPHRTSIPDPQITNPTYAWEEDPHIWISAGVYHVLYSGSGDRIGYHLYSSDGIHDWKDDGLAFDPRMADKIFCYEGSTTCTKWYKMERPGVVLEGGHVTHVTWAVADVDKDNQIPGNSNHGSKVIVVPFDGVAFDADYGKGGTAGAGGSAGVAGSAGAGTGGASTGGMGGAATSGASGATSAGAAGAGASGAAGAGTATGGTGAAGGASNPSAGAPIAMGGGGSGNSAPSGGVNAGAVNVDGDSGCTCSLPSGTRKQPWRSALLFGALSLLWGKRRLRLRAS